MEYFYRTTSYRFVMKDFDIFLNYSLKLKSEMIDKKNSTKYQFGQAFSWQAYIVYAYVSVEECWSDFRFHPNSHIQVSWHLAPGIVNTLLLLLLCQ